MPHFLPLSPWLIFNFLFLLQCHLLKESLSAPDLNSLLMSSHIMLLPLTNIMDYLFNHLFNINLIRAGSMAVLFFKSVCLAQCWAKWAHLPFLSICQLGRHICELCKFFSFGFSLRLWMSFRFCLLSSHGFSFYTLKMSPSQHYKPWLF